MNRWKLTLLLCLIVLLFEAGHLADLYFNRAYYAGVAQCVREVEAQGAEYPRDARAYCSSGNDAADPRDY